MSNDEAAPSRRRCLTAASALLLGLGAGGAKAQTAPEDLPALERIRQRGVMSIAIYNDMPPFNTDGAGIDVDLAKAIAAAVGVPLSPLFFNAGEEMADDLRNMVWRGHYLGHGPADLLLHVPVDRPLIDATPQAIIFGPYYRETLAIARRVDKLPAIQTLEPLAQERTAVPGLSLAGWLLIGADSGAYREKLVTHLKDGVAAARALQAGEVTLAAGLRSELESVLGRDPAYAIDPLPSPRAPRNGWAIGCAVKKEAKDLAQAVQQAIDGMSNPEGLGAMFSRAGVSWRRA